MAFLKNIFSVPAVERNLATDTPYVMLCMQVIMISVMFADKHGIREPCDFIFDEQLGFSAEVIRHWPLFKLSLRGSIRSDLEALIGSPPVFRNEKDFLPLQAADLYAWQARNHYVENHRVPGQTIWIPMNKVLGSFASILNTIGRYGKMNLKGNMLHFCRLANC